MAVMLPSGISVRIREDLLSGAARTQTTLVVDPLVTITGHRVAMTDIGDKGYGKLEQGTTREELMSWTGITDNGATMTLTGCEWGINLHNLTSGVNTNKKRHVIGSSFKITTDMHFLAEQYRDKDSNLFESPDDFDIKANELKLGDGTNGLNKTIVAQNGDANEPFIEYNETTGKWNISNDGVNSYDPEQGGSGVTAGDGINIVASQINVDLDQLVDDDEALDVTANRLSTKLKTGGHINKDDGLYVESVNSDTISNFETITSGADISTVDKFQGLSDAKFGLLLGDTRYEINPDFYINEAIGDSITTYNNNASMYNIWYSQSFLTGTKPFLSKVSLRIYYNDSYYTGNTYVALYACDPNDKPTGSALATKAIANNATNIPTSATWVDWELNVAVSPSTKYCIVTWSDSYSSSYYNKVQYATSSSYPNGMYASSSDGGTTWTTNSSYDLAFKTYYKDNISDLSDVAEAIEDAIQSETGGSHTFTYTNNRFVFTSANEKELAFFYSPLFGTDISGDTIDGGTKNYLDMTVNAVPSINFQAPGYLLGGKNEDAYNEFYTLATQTFVSQDVSNQTGVYIYGSNVRGQSFTTDSSGELTAIGLYLYRSSTNDSSNVTLNLYLSDENDKPTGSAIKTVTYAYDSLDISSTTGYTIFEINETLTPNTKYVITLSFAPTGGSAYVTWPYQSTDVYSGGKSIVSSNSGSTWTVNNTSDMRFKAYKGVGSFKLNADSSVYDNLSSSFGGLFTQTIVGNNNSDNNTQLYGSILWGQSFTTTTFSRLKRIGISLSKTGTPSGNINVSLYDNTNFTGTPIKTVSRLASEIGNRALYYFDFEGVDLLENTQYAFSVSVPSANNTNNIALYWYNYGGYSGGNAYSSSNSGVTWSANGYDMLFQVELTNSTPYIASQIQSAIRLATSRLEEVLILGNRFLIKSGTYGRSSSILRLMTPTTGTDISGNGTTSYLDCATNAKEYSGNGSEDLVVITDGDGVIPGELLPDMVSISSSLTKVATTVYQNISNRSKLIIAIADTAAGGGSIDYYGDVSFYIGATSTPATLISQARTKASGSYAGGDVRTVSFIVPPKYYYKYTTATNGSGSAASVTHWYEVTL